MKKSLLILCLFLGTIAVSAVPTITIDGDKSDWAEVPMVSQPGTWPVLKVIPAADAEIGSNALVFMLEGTTDFVTDWSKYPGSYIDKDYDISTNPASSWVYPQMGIDYSVTTGAQVGDDWISFEKAVSGKVIEMGIPSSVISDLGAKFGIGMYYGTGGSQEWFCPDRDKEAHPEIKDRRGFLYKTRSYTTLPGTLTVANAFAHPTMGECVDYVDFGMRDDGNDTARWAAFPIELTKPGFYSLTTNVTTTLGWKFEFSVVDVASNAVVAHLDAPESNISESKSSYTFGPIDLTAVPAGKYMLKVKNKTRNSTVKLNDIVVAYAGGADVAVPAKELLGTDAVLVDAGKLRVSKLANGDLKYGDNGSPLGEYVYWNINATKYGRMNVTANVVAPTEGPASGHQFLVELYSDLDESPISSSEEASTNATGAIPLPTLNIPETGNYIIKLTNKTQWSQAILHSIQFAYAGGEVINIPANSLIGGDAVLVAAENKLQRNGDGNLENHNPAAGTTDYAWWKIHATQTSTLNVKIKVLTGSGVGHSYTVGLYSDLAEDPIAEVAEAGDGSWATGEYSLGTFNVTKDNDYYVRVKNPFAWSNAILGSIRLSYEIPAIAETEESENAVIKVYDGKTGDVQITRSLTAGMYNTICLPFTVSAAEVARVFPGAKIKELTSSSIEEDGFVLNLNFSDAASIEAGKPYLIQPASAVVNPTFLGVTIDKTLRSKHTDKADFIGNFVVSTVPAGESNFFLGADNTLYYSNGPEDKTIKGMRAYFAVDDSSDAPKRARLVMDEETVTTDVELVNGQLPEMVSTNNVRKFIDNGQLIIVKDGAHYNAMGVRVK